MLRKIFLNFIQSFALFYRWHLIVQGIVIVLLLLLPIACCNMSHYTSITSLVQALAQSAGIPIQQAEQELMALTTASKGVNWSQITTSIVAAVGKFSKGIDIVPWLNKFE